LHLIIYYGIDGNKLEGFIMVSRFQLIHL